jgi:hypothetical protein
MFGLKMLKNLTPEQIALMGVVAATGGLAAPAALGAGAAGAATGAGAAAAGAGATAAGAGAAGTAAGSSLLSGISAEAALAGTEASLAGNVGAGLSGSIPAMGESYFGAAPGMGGSSMFDQLSRFGTQAKGYLDEANKVIKPVGNALGAAKTAQGLLSPDTPQMPAPAPQFGGGGNPVFMGLLQEQQAQSQSRMQEEMQRRQAQQKLLEMMGGR